MNRMRKGLFFALVFPFVALIALAGYKAFKRGSGVEVTIPIVGYDPRDLLSGHYLVYRLDVGDNICSAKQPDVDPVYLCVIQNNQEVSMHRVYSSDQSIYRECTTIIKGRCDRTNFVAGVERFYIPEQHSQLLDRIVRGWGEADNRAQLVIAVDGDGNAVVKNLLINDIPWRDFLAQATE